MPIYEYQCQSCGYELEKIQKISDAPLTECPGCGKPELKKKISAAAFRLKGGGWYETDFKSGDKKKNLAGDNKSAAGTSSTRDKSGGDKSGEKSKTESKPSTSAAS